MKLTNTPTEIDLKEFAARHSWRNQMDNSRGLDSWSNYVGDDLGHVVVVVGRSRDSDILDESNFECALSILGGESETVQVHRFGHWACGWFELLCVDPTDRKALLQAYEIKRALDDYPVLDDMDYSEREYEYQLEYAKNAQGDLACALVKHLGLPDELIDDDDFLAVVIQLNLECQQYYGNGSCINIYDFREPDLRDIEQVRKCLGQMRYGPERENPVYQFLCVCLDVNQDNEGA